MRNTARSKYRIWDCGVLVPAYCRKPKNPHAKKLGARTVDEMKLGIRWYIPAATSEVRP
jgi:hypothetical protein